MLLPSKELLSEVLGRDVDKVKDIEANTLIYGCVHSDGWYDEINIYELSHKCKEWAYNLKQEIIIKSYTVFNAGGCELIDKMGFSVYICDAKTEPEAIFKACEWIMEQIK